MSNSFDPYYSWLGIPPKDQPPHHYRLLSIEVFEENGDVIEHAADRVMTHLRSLQTGVHSAHSQKLLNEVASARICLLNQKSKSQYDSALSAKLSQVSHPTSAGQAKPQAEEKKRSGEKTLGDYELLESLGSSQTGEMLKARHISLGKVVAIKILSEEAAQSPQLVSRFIRKLRILANIQHPNLVAAFDGGQRAGKLFMVMEYVDGVDLITHMKTHGLFKVDQAVDILKQAAAGLACAHDHLVYHRNVKPNNLMLDRQQNVKVIGMGLARVDEEAEIGKSDEITQAGMQLGSSDFMAPEQSMDSRKVDARSDVYSLGYTFYFLLTGKLPYPVKGVMEKYIAHSTGPIPALSERRNDVPAEVEAIYQKMVAKQPADRFQSMHELLQAFDEPVKVEPISEATTASNDQDDSVMMFLKNVMPPANQPAPSYSSGPPTARGQVTIPVTWLAVGGSLFLFLLILLVLAVL